MDSYNPILVKIASEYSRDQLNDESDKRHKSRRNKIVAVTSGANAAYGALSAATLLKNQHIAHMLPKSGRGKAGLILGSAAINAGSGALGGLLLHGGQRLLTPKSVSDNRSVKSLRKKGVKGDYA